MDFEWDENKRQKVIAERDVDILYAAGIFEAAFLTVVDDRADYGEERLIPLEWSMANVSSSFIPSATASRG